MWSESLGLVCGGITFVSVEKDVGGGVGVLVGDVSSELGQFRGSKSIHDLTFGTSEVGMCQCRGGRKEMIQAGSKVWQPWTRRVRGSTGTAGGRGRDREQKFNEAMFNTNLRLPKGERQPPTGTGSR